MIDVRRMAEVKKASVKALNIYIAVMISISASHLVLTPTAEAKSKSVTFKVSATVAPRFEFSSIDIEPVNQENALSVYSQGPKVQARSNFSENFHITRSRVSTGLIYTITTQ